MVVNFNFLLATSLDSKPLVEWKKILLFLYVKIGEKNVSPSYRIIFFAWVLQCTFYPNIHCSSWCQQLTRMFTNQRWSWTLVKGIAQTQTRKGRAHKNIKSLENPHIIGFDKEIRADAKIVTPYIWDNS